MSIKNPESAAKPLATSFLPKNSAKLLIFLKYRPGVGQELLVTRLSALSQQIQRH